MSSVTTVDMCLHAPCPFAENVELLTCECVHSFSQFPRRAFLQTRRRVGSRRLMPRAVRALSVKKSSVCSSKQPASKPSNAPAFCSNFASDNDSSARAKRHSGGFLTGSCNRSSQLQAPCKHSRRMCSKKARYVYHLCYYLQKLFWCCDSWESPR